MVTTDLASSVFGSAATLIRPRDRHVGAQLDLDMDPAKALEDPHTNR